MERAAKHGSRFLSHGPNIMKMLLEVNNSFGQKIMNLNYPATLTGHNLEKLFDKGL